MIDKKEASQTLDLISEIGGKSRVSEILNRKRRLTVETSENGTELNQKDKNIITVKRNFFEINWSG